jgi:glycosyltransferase involved in cell wall biosynthesis
MIHRNLSLNIIVIGLRGFPNDYSGLERVSEELYPGLTSLGHDITIYSRNSDINPKNNIVDGVKVIRALSIKYGPLETISHAFFSFLNILFTRKKPYIIHFQAIAPAYLSFFCRIFNIPCVVTVQGLDWKRAKWQGLGALAINVCEKIAVKYCNSMIVVSEELHEYYYDKYNRNTIIISNAIDFKKQNLPGDSLILKKLMLSNQSYILSLGRLVPEKRIEDIIEAFKFLDKEIFLVISGMGKPDYTEYLKTLSKSDSRIKIIGHQNRNQIREIIRSAKIVVSASELEGLPLALIESIAMGVPIIASNIKPHIELFNGGFCDKNIFRKGDIHDLKEKIIRALDFPDEYLLLAKRLQNQKAKINNVKAMVKKTELIFFGVRNNNCKL